MVGRRFFRLLLSRCLSGRATTDSLPSLPKSTFLPSANALLIVARTVSRACLALTCFTPVFSTMEATIVFLFVFGIVTSRTWLSLTFDIPGETLPPVDCDRVPFERKPCHTVGCLIAVHQGIVNRLEQMLWSNQIFQYC